MHSWTWRVLSFCGWLLLSGCATYSDWLKLDELPPEPRVEALRFVGGEELTFSDDLGSYNIGKATIEGTLLSGAYKTYALDSISAFRLKTGDGLSPKATIVLSLFGIVIGLLIYGGIWISNHGGL